MTFVQRAFVAYRLASRGYFHLSVLFIFLLQADHSILSVAAILGVYGLATAALSPVTPRLVGLLGPGRALVVGELLKASGLLVLVLGGDVLGLAVAAQTVNALGFSLAMSADAAVLNRIADPNRSRELQAATQSLMFLALLASGVAGGALYLLDPRWPLAAGAVAALAAAAIAAVLAHSVPQDAVSLSHAPKAADPTDAGSMPKEVASAEIRWISYYATTRGFMLGTFIGLIPFLIYSVLGASVLTLTLYLACYSLAAFVTARYANRILDRAGAVLLMAATAVVLSLALLIFAMSSTFAVVAVALVLLGAASGCVRPATMAQLAAASQEFRGTTPPGWLLSRMEGIFGLCNALVVLIGGALIWSQSFTVAMLTLCGAYVVLQIVAEVYVRRQHAVERRRETRLEQTA